MSFYHHYGEDSLELPPPRGVYAILDSTEPDIFEKSDTFFALFEAIDLEAYDSNVINMSSIPDGILEKFVSVLEVRILPETRDIFQSALDLTEDENERNWIEVLFNDTGEVEINHYLNLFSPPIPRRATVNILDSPKSNKLNKSFDISHLRDASAYEIVQAISTQDHEAAAVYDVGQGNCNAIIDRHGFPILYYDFGGGVLGHRNTYPRGLSEFCFSSRPAIVLSHWDWDHWSSAKRTRSSLPNQEAIAATWVVPRQYLGPVHRGLLAQLQDVRIWPNSVASVQAGDIRVHKCSGSKTNRNRSGLVLECRTGWAQGDGVLFTGDCDYRFLPPTIGTGRGFDAIVLPHHGAQLAPSSIPIGPPSGANYVRCCVSCGIPNQYGHPSATAISAHNAAGWNSATLLQTYKRKTTSSGLAGHILIDPKQAVPLKPVCNHRYCQTELVQV